MRAILLISHGSYSSKTKQEIEVLVDRLKHKLRDDIIEYAFLEIDHPSILEGINNCLNAGADEILMALNFLNSGRHVDEDIPAVIKTAQMKFPEIKFRVTKPIGHYEGFVNLFADLLRNPHSI